MKVGHLDTEGASIEISDEEDGRCTSSPKHAKKPITTGRLLHTKINLKRIVINVSGECSVTQTPNIQSYRTWQRISIGRCRQKLMLAIGMSSGRIVLCCQTYCSRCTSSKKSTIILAYTTLPVRISSDYLLWL